MSQASSLIEKLAKINDENTIDVFVPSLNKSIKFKSLNIKQQKELIKTSMDGAASGATLNQTFNNIIIDNSTEQVDFKIYDKYAIIIALRAAIIGPEYSVKDRPVNLIDELKNNIKRFKALKFENGCALKYHTIGVDLELPNLKKDLEINDKFIKTSKDLNDSNFSDAIGKLYIYEIIKFINYIKLDGEESEEYVFNNISIKDKISIVESLPVALNTQIIEYIESIRDIENLFLSAGDDKIEINAAFFTKA